MRESCLQSKNLYDNQLYFVLQSIIDYESDKGSGKTVRSLLLMQ